MIGKMRERLVVNPDSTVPAERLREYVDAPLSGSVRLIYQGRNSLRSVDTGRMTLVVKDFSRTFKNRLLYASRRSKACKSYENALELLRRGILTPAPVGYVERRTASGMLACSFYVSEFDDTMELGDYLDGGGHEALHAFACFMARLHKAGIRHDDLNRTNVRVVVADDGTPVFSLIDLNRMKIYPAGAEVPVDDSFRNLCRFSPLDDGFRYFVGVYLSQRGFDLSLAGRAIEIKQAHNRRVDRKKWFKRTFLHHK